jgi:hypothetical protein
LRLSTLLRSIGFSTIALLALQPVANAQRTDEGEGDALRRLEYLNLQRSYPFTTVPPHLKRIEAVRQFRGSFSLSGSPALMAPGDWTSIGPAPLTTTSSSGRVSAIAVHPTNPQTIYVGGAQGGVWKSVNGGSSWTPLGDTQCSLAIGSIALDPQNPNIVYVGTGEQNYSGDSYYGCGVLKSTDGGQTWTTLGSSIFDTTTGGAQIGRLIVIPSGTSAPSTTILAGTSFGFYRSTDGGVNWTQTTIPGSANRHVTDIVVDPRDTRIVFAAFTTAFSNSANGIYKSTDNGISFARVTQGLPATSFGRAALALAATNPDSMYVAIHSTADGRLLGIYRSANAGSTWTQLTATRATCATQCWYDIVISVDPRNSSIIYFGGVQLFKSTDAGATFNTIGTSIHVDQHAFAFDPSTAGTLYAGNDGGIWKSSDNGAAFTSLNTNLAITQFWGGLSFGSAGPGELLGGTQDNGTVAYSGTTSWPRTIGGDGGFTAVNPLTGMAFGETQWNVSAGGVFRSASYTGPFTLASNGISSPSTELGVFIPPLRMDMERPHTLYFGTRRLYRTRDNGDTWVAINSGAGKSATTNISVMAAAASDSNVVYVATTDGNVQLTTDGGLTWRNRIVGLANRYVSDIVVHRSNADIAYVVLSGFGVPHVWKTENGGVTWTSISAGLPDMPVNAIALLPDGSLVIGADLGVYRSANDGASWQPFGNGLPNVAVQDVVYHAPSSTLVAATHGRSAFAASLSAAAVPVAVALTTQPLSSGSGVVFPSQPVARIVGPAGDRIGGSSAAVTASIATGNGTLSGTTIVNAVNGVATFTDLAVLGAGEVTLRFSASGLTSALSAPFPLLALRGDITNDGIIGSGDALAILQLTVGTALPTGYKPTPNADANCDGTVNSIDAAVILAYLVGRDVTRFCVGKAIQ